MAHRSGAATRLNVDDSNSAASDAEIEATVSEPLLQVDQDEGGDGGLDDGILTTKTRLDHAEIRRPRAVRPRLLSRLSLVVTVSLATTIVTLAAVLLFRPRSRTAQNFSGSHHHANLGRHWHGFSRIEYMFSYGDSWTDTHFRPWLEQPSTRNPLGNPAWPGETSTNAANYVGYLAASYNRSFIKAHDFAFSGSTIDASVDLSLLGWLDLVHQVKDAFLPFYTTKNGTDSGDTVSPVGWTSENSLFTTFFGINDAVVINHTEPPYDVVFSSYADSIGKLYNASARNFVVLNIPPIEKSPAITSMPVDYQHTFAKHLRKLNAHIKLLVERLRETYDDITVFEVDIYGLFNRVIADPSSMRQTACYKDVTTTCDEWQKGLVFGGAPTPEQIEKCHGLSVEEYLWINPMHVTWPVHDAMAAEIQRVLLEEGAVYDARHDRW